MNPKEIFRKSNVEYIRWPKSGRTFAKGVLWAGFRENIICGFAEIAPLLAHESLGEERNLELLIGLDC